MTVDDCDGGLAKNWLVFTTTPADTNPGDRLTGGGRARCVVKNTRFRKTHQNAIIVILLSLLRRSLRVTCRIEFITVRVTFSNIHNNI